MDEHKGLKGKISTGEKRDHRPNRIHLPRSFSLSGETRCWVIFAKGHHAKRSRLGHFTIKFAVSKEYYSGIIVLSPSRAYDS